MLRHCDQRSGGFTMTKSNLRLVSPHAVIGTVPPRRVPNAELRTREYLTEAEVERLINIQTESDSEPNLATSERQQWDHGRPA